MTLQDFLHNKRHNTLKEILQSHPFLMSSKFRNAGLLMVRSQNGLNLFLHIKGIVKQGLGHLFITLRSSHFFDETYLKQYL